MLEVIEELRDPADGILFFSRCSGPVEVGNKGFDIATKTKKFWAIFARSNLTPKKGKYSMPFYDPQRMKRSLKERGGKKRKPPPKSRALKRKGAFRWP